MSNRHSTIAATGGLILRHGIKLAESGSDNIVICRHDRFSPMHNQNPGSAEGRASSTALGELAAFARNVAGSCASATQEERLHIESQSVVHWARDTHRLLDPVEFKRLLAHLKVQEGGAEHQVAFLPDRGRMLKLTRPPYFGRGTLLDYASNLIWSNYLFEDDIQLEGILDSEEGVSIVITQPFIEGRSPTTEEVAAWFAVLGYCKNGHNRWKHPDDGMDVADTHTGNFVVMSDGLMVPIDLQVLHPGKEYFASANPPYTPLPVF